MEYLAWPVAIIIIAFIFMLMFRQSINKFLGKIKEIGRKGIRTNSDHPRTTTEPSLAYMEEIMRAFASSTIIAQEKMIRKDLEEKKILDESEKIKILITALATTQIILYYEQIYNCIWGSQLSLLQHLNSFPDGDTSEGLRIFYDSGATGNSGVYGKYPFERYLNYLTKCRLIDKHDDNYLITQFGRDFLVYLTSMGKEKPRFY